MNNNETAKKLIKILKSFNIEAFIQNIIPRQVSTKYNVILASGTKFQKLKEIVDKISIAMKTSAIRIEQIPKKNVVCIEIPNSKVS